MSNKNIPKPVAELSANDLVFNQGIIPFALSAIGKPKLTKYVSTAIAVGLLAKSAWNFVKSRDVEGKYTTIKIYENQDFFEYVVRWLSQLNLTYKGSEFEFVDLSNIKNGPTDMLGSLASGEAVKTFNYNFVPSGTCQLFVDNIPVKITWEKMARDNNNAKWAKDFITVSVKSKNKKDLTTVFDCIYEAGSAKLNKPKTVVYTYLWSWKVNRKLFHVRDVVLPHGEFDKLKNDIEYFLDNRDWYESVQAPYRRGYLLHGIHGAGKGTTVSAIATHFNLDVYVINLSEMTDDKLMEAISYMPEKSILLLEDVDCSTTDTRDTKDTRVSFSGLLNILDGICVGEGRITFLTTNHREKLSPTLIRPGRVDYEIEYFNATKEQIFDLAVRFKYKKAVKIAEEWAEEGICMAEVQNRLIILTRAQKGL